MAIREDRTFTSIIFTAAIIFAIVVSSILLARHFELGPYFLHLLPANVYEVTRAADNLPVSTVPPHTLEVSDIVELRQLLEKEQFDQLNSVLQAYQEIFENNQADEYRLYDAYRTFECTLPAYEALLQRWLQATPDTYQPYLALAQYYYARAWASRGSKWAKDTSGQQFAAMNAFFEKAQSNLNKALEIDPNLMIAYNTLLGIYNAQGNYSDEDRIIAKANERFPGSFLIRLTISWAKQPRWGGSYPQMEALAKEAERFADQNPKIPVLYGLIYQDQAGKFRRAEKYEKALALLGQALAFGDHWSFYNDRAKIYHYDLNAYDQALENVNRSIALRPVLHQNRLMRSKIYYAQAEYDESLTDLQTAALLKPGNPEIQEWRKWAADNLMQRGHQVFKKDRHAAVGYYNMSLKFDANNFQAYYWRGRALAASKDLEAALSDFQAALKINPRHFDSCRMVDYIYAQRRQWDKIIACWNQFIALEPDHADAYYERAGTYYHNNDMKSALRDLKKACKLGNQQACQRYDRLTP